MKTIYKIASLVPLLLFSSCSETFFNVESEEGTGTFIKQSLLLDLRDDSEVISNAPTRAGEFDDFKILFFKNNEIVPEKSYVYSDMPDIVVLPVGSYTVTATKGTDVAADWDSPYFLGESDYFDIRKDNITTDIDPIVCRLQNVKVSVEFDSQLIGAMSPDSYVEVKVGDNAGLQFTAADEGRAGYYHHTDGVSMVATFRGDVEGSPTVETKSFDTVEKGYHYKIRFRLHSQDSSHSGEADADLNVDASVTTVNLENNVVIGEDEILDDSERPKEDIGGGDDEPTPPSAGNFEPQFLINTPSDLEFDKEYNVTADDIASGISLTVKCNPGITGFIVEIISPNLTPSELKSANLSDKLDLVNPGELAEPLSGLGFPVNISGQTEVDFSIPQLLMTMLNSVGGGNSHTFRLTVTNEFQGEGETSPQKHTVVKDLILKL